MIEGCAAKHIVLAESIQRKQHCIQVTTRGIHVELAGTFVWDDALLDAKLVLSGLDLVERAHWRRHLIISGFSKPRATLIDCL
jgi:hypothetical protein